jgi:Retrotransposon gag protein/Zinc knuckle
MGTWIDSLDPVNDDIQEVWDMFMQEFNDHFADLQLQQRARLELDRCKMHFPDVDQYILDFKGLVHQAGYTIGNEETIGFFMNGLTPSVLDEVIRSLFPMTYNEYKEKAVNITKGRQMIELIRARWGLPNPRPFNSTFRQNQRPAYNSTNAPRPVYNNVQVPMDLSCTRAPYNWCQYQGNNTYTNAMSTQPGYDMYGNVTSTPTQQDYHHPRTKGPCFNCGKPGHFIKDCCSNPSSNINYMDAMDNDM